VDQGAQFMRRQTAVYPSERLSKLETILAQTLHDQKAKPSGLAFTKLNSVKDIASSDDAFTDFIGFASALVEHGSRFF
jgi:hypothetical protein